ncbi:MAG: PA14 domain-containing protein [Phycisphaerales bacterium]
MSTIGRNHKQHSQPNGNRKANRTRRATSWHAQAMEPLESRILLSAGGGFTDAGIVGEYFANTTLSGSPAFTRKEVRVEFDWGGGAPGGSTSPGYADVGADYFSARWTGRIIAAFSEQYTFQTQSDDGVRLHIKPTSSQTWTTVIDNWTPHTTQTDTGVYAMTAGETYDIRMEYYENNAGAVAKLSWSSPSTPLEVIDPLAQSGTNATDWTAGYLDIMKGARNSWVGPDYGGPAPAMDADGWPMGDGQYVFQESLNHGLAVDPLMRGLVTFSFKGIATIVITGNVTSGSLQYSYDPATNTTSGSFLSADLNINASFFRFNNSHRDGQPTGPGGITDLKMMRPIAPDATTSYSPTEGLFTPQFKDSLSHFTVIRHQYVANQQMHWSDRTPVDYFNQSGGGMTAPYYGYGSASNNGPSWEYKIMLSNETGRDLMISIPTVASDDYLLNLANLIKYGSDANGTPYTTATADPVHPGLNPNLRVYLELENELWNWASVFYTDFRNLNAITAADADANNADFQIINYDNLSTAKDVNGEYVSLNTWRYRKIMLRMIQASDIFRGVFGDAAMPGTSTDPIIRPLYEWQYANTNDTARLGLAWAEKYFNNGDGVQHVANPRPLNYYIWGGGGATYYGANNPNGLTNLPADNSFDAVGLAAGYNPNPAGTMFTFTGTAGIAVDSGTSDDIPTPLNGNQVGYITDQGSISFDFTVPTGQVSDVYAFSFKAVNRIPTATGIADTENLRVYLDGTIDITAKTYSQGNGYTPPGYNASQPWKALNVSWTWSDYYFTKLAHLTAGSTHTITIQGMGDIAHIPANTNQTVLIDDVRITSEDAIYAGGIPGGGEATGQPVGQNIRNSMSNEADWAKAFGLEELSYESGWSLGGDDGGSWIQTFAKYGDPRTAAAQQQFMTYFAQSGSAVNVFGTYSQWPSWADYYAEQGLLNVSAYPIIQGIDAAADALPAEVTNGLLASAILTPANSNIIDHASNVSGQITAAGGWINWTVIAPRTGYYTLALTTTGAGGTAAILADGQQVASGATNGVLTADVFLVKGNHSIRAGSKAATTFTVSQMTISGQNAPAVPTLNSAIDGDGSATLNWSAVTGATGYIVRYGTATGVYPNALDVGNVTDYTLTGLTNNQAYLFAIEACNAGGASLPSNEKGVVPLAPAQTGTLLYWDFADNTASTPVSDPVTGNTAKVTVSEITRGVGLRVDNVYVPAYTYGCFGSLSNDGTGGVHYGVDLPGAIAKNQYYQFTVTPAAGYTASLSTLDFMPYFQNSASGSPGAGYTYSIDGVNFSGGTVVPGTPMYRPAVNTSHYITDLSGLTDLQNTTSTVTFRIYLFGLGNYQWSGLGGIGQDVIINGSYVPLVPAAPTLNNADGGDGSVTLNWSGVPLADGYKIRYGTASGNYTHTLDVGNVTNHTLTGLTNDQPYFFAVDAYNLGGESPASNELSVIPLAPAQTGTLLYWDFAQYVNYTPVSAPVIAGNSNVTVSEITRGSGLRPDTTYVPAYLTGAFASLSNDGTDGIHYGVDLPGAIAKNQYYQFTVTPAVGDTVSLNSLAFLPYFQNPDPGCGAGYTYSTDGINFSGGTVVPGTPNHWPIGNDDYFTTDLSGLIDLQNATSTVTFRIYLFGLGNYEWSGLGGIGQDVSLIGSYAPIVPPAVNNASFDGTSVSTYVYDPTGTGWTFTGNSGIQHDGSAWGAPLAPDGTQTAFLQSGGAGATGQNGQISQTLNFTAAGNYTLDFQAARRAYTIGGGIQSVGVYLDGVLLQTFTPSSTTSWDAISLNFNIAAAGNHTIMFAAMNSSGDQSLFLDDIHLTLTA